MKRHIVNEPSLLAAQPTAQSRIDPPSEVPVTAKAGKAKSQARRRARQAVPMGLRFLEENEQRIRRQKELIKQLKAAKRDSAHAEATLKAFEQTQIKLLNHWQLMQNLMRETADEKG